MTCVTLLIASDEVLSSRHSYTLQMSSIPKRIGVFGGTFDPPHIGHLVAANTVRSNLQLDEVVVVVANEPWQKTDSRDISPASDRLAMVRAAVAGHVGLRASALEIDRGGPTYSIDTLTELRRKDSEAELFLIVGADAAGGLSTWHRASELPNLATLVVVSREGDGQEEHFSHWNVERVSIPRLEISSSDLRDRIGRGLPVDWIVPQPVIEVLTERRLYGLGAP